jgi:hypothetical protein
MSDQPTLFDLFDATSLQNCRRLLQNGEIPTSVQLADILEANATDRCRLGSLTSSQKA